jgi:hypothetical protein
VSEEETDQSVEEKDQPQGASTESEGQERDFDKEFEDAKQEVKDLEEDPPEKLGDWPAGRAKYETFGGPEHESSYDEAATSKLGPSNVRFYDDGAVSVDGEDADQPEEFKGEPIPGGPTDPDAPSAAGERDEGGDQDEGERDESEKDEG